jgi:hypothetical protein
MLWDMAGRDYFVGADEQQERGVLAMIRDMVGARGP